MQRSDAVWFISRGVVAEELARGLLFALDLPGLPGAGPVGLTQRAGAAVSDEQLALTRCLRASVAERPA